MTPQEFALAISRGATNDAHDALVKLVSDVVHSTLVSDAVAGAIDPHTSDIDDAVIAGLTPKLDDILKAVQGGGGSGGQPAGTFTLKGTVQGAIEPSP